MRKLRYVIIIGVIIVAITGIAGIYLKARTADFSFVDSGTAIFRYDDINISVDLSTEELLVLQDIFGGKFMYKDNPSCGFSDSVAVVFNGTQTICIACDGCPVLYWKEIDLYFMVTEEEQSTIYSLLEAHGFYFPCV